MLVCPNCRTILQDLGGDLSQYSCSVCDYAPLQRVTTPADKDSAVGLLAGAAVGATFFGLPGAIIGAVFGALLGAQKDKPTCQ